MKPPNVVDPPEPELQIVSRAEWGAIDAPGDLVYRNKKPAPYLLWTFSNSDHCYSKEDCSRTMRELQRRHIEELGLPDIQYNFYIGGDLNIYEGRGWDTFNSCLYPGYSLAEKMNVGVAYIGRYENQNYPNEEVLQKQMKLAEYAVHKQYLLSFYGKMCLTTNITY